MTHMNRCIMRNDSRKALFGALRARGYTDRWVRLAVASAALGRIIDTFKAASETSRDLVDIAIDTHMAGGGRVNQIAGIDVPCRMIAVLRRKLFVEIAGDTAIYHP